MANNDKENKIKKFTKEAIGKTLNQFNKEIGIADLVEINKNQDRILNGILSQVNDENTEKTEKSNIITLDNSTDGIVELKEIQGDTNVNVSKIEEMPITHDIGDKEGNVFTLNEIPKGAISIGEIQGNTMVNCNKDDKKELVLMKDLSTQGDNNITLTEGVDGGKIDVALEGNTLVNVSKTKDDYITHEREEDTTGNHVALADEGYIRPVLNGKTMVNVCDQKDSIAVTKSYAVENSGNHIALQGEYDGSCRPVVTGNTLVNIIQAFWDDADAEYDFSTGRYKVVADGTSKRLYYNVNAKTNTKYTVIANIKKNTINNNFALVGWNVTPDNKQVTVPSGFVGLFVNVMTTRESDLDSIWGTDLWKESTEGEIEIDGFMILEGDYTDKPIPDYFIGLQSSFEDGLVTQEMIDSGEEVADNLGKYKVDYKVTGKNKYNQIKTPFNPDFMLLEGATITKNGDNIVLNGTLTKLFDYRPTWLDELYNYVNSYSEGTILTLSNNLNGVNYWMYTENGSVHFDQNSVTIRSSMSNISCFVRFNEGTTFNESILNVQLEEGVTATSYEPYKEYTKTLYLNSPLLEGDTIEQYGNNIAHVHRYGKVVLDGSESWNNSDNNYAYVLLNHLGAKASGKLICDKLIPGSSLSGDIFIGTVGLGIHYNDTNRTNLVTLLSWLQANPTTVVYELASPQYEVISTNDELLTDSYVNGHLDFESAVPVEKVIFNNLFLPLKYQYPNTNYTIQFESDNQGKIYIMYSSGANLSNRDVVKGINKFDFTTNASPYPNILINGIGFNASNIVVTPTIEQDFGYFSGLSNTFESELITDESSENYGKYKVEYRVIGKNKFDGTVYLGGGCIIENGAIKIPWWSQYAITKNIPVKPNTQYTSNIPKYNGTPSVDDFRAIFFDKNNKIISFISEKTFVTPNNCYSVRLTSKFVQSGNVDISLISEWQLEEGDIATSYEPYKEYTKTLYLNSPLLEGDTIEQQDGGIYHVHRSEKLVLDGSELGWQDNAGEGDTVNGHGIWNVNLTDGIGGLNPVCDKLLCVNSISSIANKTNFILAYAETSAIVVNIANAITRKDVTDWLKNNKPSLIIQLKTPTYELIEQSNLAVPSYSNGHLDLPSAVPISKINFLHFEEELTYLYPSTSYTVQFISDKAIAVDITLGGTQLLAQNIVVGLNRISITTPETLADNRLVIDGVGAKISKIIVTDTNREFKYFEGMKSVGECEELEIKSNNKNLFDFDTFFSTTEGFTVTRGIFTVDTNNKTLRIQNTNMHDCHTGGIFTTIGEQLNDANKHKAIRVEPDTHYCFTANISGGGICNVYVAEHDSDYKLLRFASFSASSTLCSASLYTTTNTKYVVLRFSCLEVGTEITVSNIQFEEGSTATEYIPHKSNSQILNHEPLRAVGDTKDRYVLLDGKWYIERRCEEVVFDGSETIGDVSAIFPSDNSRMFYVIKEDAKNISSSIVCDKFKANIDIAYVYTNIEGAFVSMHDSDSAFYFRIFNDKLSTQDTDGFKEWLQNNPTKVVYQPATPVYEPIDYNPLEVYQDTTHITTNSAIPTNIKIKNHGYNCLLKPNATYTVSSNLGLNTVTTGADIGDSCLRFYDTDTSDITKMRDVLILERDWTSKADLIPANFSGIESCFEQELVTDESDEHYGKYRVNAKVVGKNLFDINKVFKTRPDTDFTVSGNVLTVSGMWFIDYIIPNEYKGKTLTMSYRKEGVGRISLFKYTDNYYPVQAESINRTTFVIPNDNYQYRFVIYGSLGSSGTTTFTNIQLEQGDTATEYEPYKESDVTFYINEPLRGVGDSKDRVFIQGDKVIVERNCSTFTLNSKNGFYLSVGGWENKTDVCTFEKYKPTPTAILDRLITHYADTVPSLTFYQHREESGSKGIEGISTHESGGFVLSIKRSKLKTQDIDGLDEYLRNNPINVTYQLAEPTYEEVEYSSNRLILNTFNNESFNNSTLFLDTNISPKLSFKPLYEELVYVKNSTKYYIQFNAVGSGEVVINLGGTELTTEIVEGYNCIPITTPSESTNLMTIIGQGITISEVIVSEVVCGGYYKGLQSCFEEHMENGKYRVLLRGIALDGSKVNGIKLYINEPLRGIGDVKDRLCIKNGKLIVERKCNSVTLDGSDDENWVHSADGTKTQRCSIRLPLTAINGKYLCDRYEVVDHSAYDKELLFVNADNVYLRVPLDNYSISNVKKYLQQNPVTVVYQLAEPTYEEATNEYGLPIVFEGYENGIVYIDSAVTPTTHIKYTSNNQLATTLSEAEEQNIATQEDINMNVITYMMDIDMMLTDMEMSNDISVMAVRRDSSNENMLDRMSDEDKKVYRDNTVVMLEKMITANVLDKEDIEGRINMYYDKNRISKEQYKYLKSLL